MRPSWGSRLSEFPGTQSRAGTGDLDVRPSGLSLAMANAIALRKPWIPCFLIFVLALGVREVRLSRWPGCLSPNVDQIEVSRIAESIAWQGKFADPYMIPTGPTAHNAPIYPFLLSLVYALPAQDRLTARLELNILFGSLLCALIYAAGLALGMGAVVSGAAAILIAVFPPSLYVELCNDSDATLAGLLAAVSITASAAWLRGLVGGTVWLGLLWGFCLLSSPTLFPIFCGFLCLCVVEKVRRRALLTIMLFALLVLTPWTLRNRLALGHWVLVRDNLGLELRVSNADNAYADSTQNLMYGAMQTFHPLFNEGVAQQVRAAGEIAVYSKFQSETIAWIRSKPTRFWALTRERIRSYWLYDGSGAAILLWNLLMAAAAVGLVLLWKAQPKSGWLMASLLGLYPVLFYLVQSYERYRYPVQWAIVLLAAFAIGQGVRTLSALLRGTTRGFAYGR